MLINLYSLLLIIFYFIICSYEDFKKKETYDFYNFLALFSFIILSICYILIFNKFQIIYNLAFTIFLGIIFAILFFYLGFWGGGDSKFLLSFSVLFHFILDIFPKTIHSYKTIYFYNLLSSSTTLFISYLTYFFVLANLLLIIFLLIKFRKKSFFLNIYFLILTSSFLFYNFTFSIFFCFLTVIFFFISDKHFQLNKKNYFIKIIILEISILMIINILTNQNYFSIFISFFKFIYYTIISGGILLLPYIFYLYFKNMKNKKLFNNLEKYLFYIFVIIFISSLFFLEFRFILLISLLFLYYLFKILKFVEKKFFIKEFELKRIVPGDWIQQDIKKNGKIIFKKERFKLGIEEKDLLKLKNIFPVNKKFLVKDGVAFIPIMFLGFIIFLIFEFI